MLLTMRTSLLSILTFLFFLIGDQSASAGSLRVVENGPLYADPSTDARVIGKVEKGMVLEDFALTFGDGCWHFIGLPNGKTGHVRCELVEEIAKNTASLAVKTTGGIPKVFIGTWVEVDRAGKQSGKMQISDNVIVWERVGVPSERITSAQIELAQDSKTFSFPSHVAVAENLFFPADQIVGKATVDLSLDNEELVVKVSGVKIKRDDGSGLYQWKGGTSISFEVVDGKEIAVIEFPPEAQRYSRI